MNVAMTDTMWLVAMGVSVAWGIPILGWALRRVLRKVYTTDTERPDTVPSKHGVDRRVRNR